MTATNNIRVWLVECYETGWLWIEENEFAHWRLRFGFPPDFQYSEWQKPMLPNDRARLVNQMVKHFESIHHPAHYHGE